MGPYIYDRNDKNCSNYVPTYLPTCTESGYLGELVSHPIDVPHVANRRKVLTHTRLVGKVHTPTLVGTVYMFEPAPQQL